MKRCVLALVSAIVTSVHPARAAAGPPTLGTVSTDLAQARSHSAATLRMSPPALPPIWQNPAEAQRPPARKKHRKDSLRNGALIGAGIGAALGIFTSRMADCPGDDASGPCPGARVAGFLVATATGALVGVGIDALLDEQTAVPGLATPRRTLLQRRRRAGVRVAIRW